MNLINSKYKISGALESLPGGREENQDFMGFADTQLGFVLILCDGMGGGPGGFTASTTVVDAVINHLKDYAKGDDINSALRQAIAFADKKIAELIKTSPVLTGMGTTIVVLVINNNSAYVAHIGDSRLYQFRFGYMVFRTADHSQVGELVRQGKLSEEQARISPNSNIITQAINGSGFAQPDITELPYEKGDRFVLCSDGIWGSMPEKHLIKDLTKTKSLSGTAVQVAFDVDEIGKNAGGKHDNLSIAIVETQTNSKLKVKMGKKFRTIIFILMALLILSILANIYTVSSLCSSPNGNPEVDSLKEKFESISKEATDLQARLKQKSITIDSISDDLKKNILENMTLKEENQNLKKEKDNLKAKLENVESKNSLQKPTEPSNVQQANSPSQQKSTKQKDIISSSINIISNWLVDIDNKNPITDRSIDELINKLKKYSKNPNVNNAIGCLQSAKKSYKMKNQREEGKHFRNAKNELVKVK
jgi:protein phosphatase